MATTRPDAQDGAFPFEETIMSKFSVRALRSVLAIDAASALVTSAAHVLLTGRISMWFGLPEAWIERSAWIMAAAGLLAGALSLRVRPTVVGVRTVALVNFAWVCASVWAAWGAEIGLTGLGMVWVNAQAAFVLAIAILEWTGSQQVQCHDIADASVPGHG